MEVKKEPPGDFVLTLPTDSTAEEDEEDVEPQAEAKEEPHEEKSLLVLLPSTTEEQSEQAKTRQRPKKHSSGGFKSKTDLQEHSRKKPIHICVICDDKFSSKVFLNRHQNKLHGVLFKCDKCSFQTTNENLLSNHKWTHGQPFACSTCQKLYSTNKAMLKHQRQHRHGIYTNSADVAFFCDICDKSFSSPNYLKGHQNSVHDESKAECEVCGKICKNRVSLRTHRRLHVKVECSICHKMITKISLTYHMHTHSAQNLFECDLCEYSANKKGSLKGHIKRNHLKKKLVNESKRLKIAEVDFHRNQLRAAPQPEVVNLKAEAQGESSKEPKWWVKSVKLEKFDEKWRIKSKPFQDFLACPQCQLVVRNRQSLSRHLNYCGKIKPAKANPSRFECHECGIRFQMNHSSVRNFCSKKCGIGFKTKSALKTANFQIR